MNKIRHLTRTSKAAIGLVLLVFLYLVVHHLTQNKTLSLPVPKVVVQQPVLANITDYVIQTGNTVAFNAVNLVARIEGYLEQVEFTDGSFVKKGQELFVIEPEPYLEKVKEAEASVTAQKAAYEYDKAEYRRQQQMYKENATSLNSVEKWLAKSHMSQAEVAKTTANARIASINYSYTHILAPFDGRIGRHLVDPGNLVGNGTATNLATIEQIDPIYVYFNLNELDLFKIRKAAQAQGIQPKDINQISVDVALQNETGFTHKGQLDFVNTGLNASTGTMEFRAILPNKNYALLPGLFVQIRIPVSQPTPKLTVPDTAVQYDQIGAYLLVVDKKNVVVLKRVEVGSVEQGMRSILKGIDSQDKVIVEGLQNAIPGNPVIAQSHEISS